MTIKGWRMVSQVEFNARIIDVLKPTDYLSRTYVESDGQLAELYIGYHGGGKGVGEIHSPKHCLPGSGWYATTAQQTRLDVDGRTINLVETVYQKGNSKELFLYWFQVKERSITSEYSLKLSEIINSLLYRRRDASFVRISIPVDGSLEQATTAGEKFVRDLYPVILGFLPT
jgi:EpsI family protein